MFVLAIEIFVLEAAALPTPTARKIAAAANVTEVYVSVFMSFKDSARPRIFPRHGTFAME